MDSVLSNNVTVHNVISGIKQDVKILESLFDCILSGKNYDGNEYIWNVFNAFIDQKQKIEIGIDNLSEYCESEGLLGLTVSEILKGKYDEHYSEDDKYKGKNLLKREILSIFNNVTYLKIVSYNHPISFNSLLTLINGTNLTKIELWGEEWLSNVKEASTFKDVLWQYKQANFRMEFGEYNTDVIITYEK